MDKVTTTRMAQHSMFCYTEVTRDVLEEIARERHNQDVQWGGLEHDDQHDPAEWLQFIDKQVYNARDACQHGTSDAYRSRLLKIAALAVAAVEAVDRAYPRPVRQFIAVEETDGGPEVHANKDCDATRQTES